MNKIVAVNRIVLAIAGTILFTGDYPVHVVACEQDSRDERGMASVNMQNYSRREQGSRL